jgi:hypothetical protein
VPLGQLVLRHAIQGGSNSRRSWHEHAVQPVVWSDAPFLKSRRSLRALRSSRESRGDGNTGAAWGIEQAQGRNWYDEPAHRATNTRPMYCPVDELCHVTVIRPRIQHAMSSVATIVPTSTVKLSDGRGSASPIRATANTDQGRACHDVTVARTPTTINIQRNNVGTSTRLLPQQQRGHWSEIHHMRFQHDTKHHEHRCCEGKRYCDRGGTGLNPHAERR